VLVNARIQDWWGSHAVGQRRLLCLTPLFAIGLGRALASLAARPLLAAGALLAPLALWNVQFEYVFNSEMVAGKGQSVSLDLLAPAQVEAAYWKLLRWEGALPGPLFVLAYDNLKGVWLDEGPRSLRGVIDLGSEPPELPQVVGHNWYRPEQDGDTTYRRSKGRRSWLRVPVRTPGGFAAVLRARSEMNDEPVTVAVQWNGQAVGPARPTPATAARTRRPAWTGCAWSGASKAPCNGIIDSRREARLIFVYTGHASGAVRSASPQVPS
jgi:hypothetical protein